MNNLDVLTIETATDKSKELLNNSIKSFGVVPNLHGVLAVSPSTLEAYQQLHALALDSSFTKEELTIVWQSINVEHDCHYCIPGHAMIAHSMKIDSTLIDALENKQPMPTEKFRILQNTTLKILQNRGKISADDVEEFYKAGYGPQQLVEIILVLSQKVISNYVNHLADTPVDGFVKDFLKVK